MKKQESGARSQETEWRRLARSARVGGAKQISGFSLLCCALLFLPAAFAQANYPDLLNQFPYRNLGPFRAGAWADAIAVSGNPHVFYAGVRTGGVWKTTNNGITFENVTDSVGLNSVGAIAVAPSDDRVVWVGSGDNTLTRSSYYGNGVYKSTDAGATWQRSGLEDSQHIARIVIHPTNPNIVWVASLGHLFSSNAERGVFKTTDGGRTWKKALYRTEDTGAIDLIIDPRDPNVLYAALYQGMRHPWHLDDGGPESGIYKTTDGGSNWSKLISGLPSGPVGRIGLDICLTHPDTVYAVMDNFNMRAANPDQPGRGGRGGRGPQLIGGEVYRTDDAGKSWRRTSMEGEDVSRKAGYSFNQIRVDPVNPDRIYVTGSNMIASRDAGKTWAGLGNGGGRGRGGEDFTVFRGTFGDFRTLWIDPKDPQHMLAGSDGGVSVTYDGGRTADHLFNIKAGEVYAIGLDNADPYNIYAGLQDHENWKGPVNGPNGTVGIEDWVTTGIGDGMYNEVDSTGRYLYNTQEFGKAARVDQQEHTRTLIAPTRAEGQAFLRFNWTAPIRVSPHDDKVIYAGAQVLFRSTDRGDTWKVISPDLTTNDSVKITPPPGTSIQFCTITTIAESQAQAGVIWVGTDDGKVQVTRDTGAHWFDATPKIAAAGGPADAWVTRVYPSPSQPGAAYITKSRRRFDDFRPFVFGTTDFGATWKDLSKGLPSAANVIIEDPAKPGLLFVGTDTGVFASFNNGAQWWPLKSNMPVVPVSDMLIQPHAADLVVGTYGRGIWQTHISPLREMGGDFLKQEAVLFNVQPFSTRRGRAWGNFHLYGDRYPTTQNEPNAMTIAYFLSKDMPVSITVADASGKVVRKLNGPAKAGINRTQWDLNDDERNPVAVGTYTVTLNVGGKDYKRPAKFVSRAPEDSPRPGGRFGG
jgi:photosystem II stability/assembly factor-like uncharacterized protein